MREIPFAAALAALLLAAGGAAAQEGIPEEPAATFAEAVRVEVVNVEVFVTDRKGNPVTDLTAADFALFENGEPRPVVNFYSEVDGRPQAPAAPSTASGDTTAGDTAAGSSATGEGAAATGETAPPDAVPPDAAPAPDPQQRLHLVVFVDNTHLRAAHRGRVFDSLREFLDRRIPPTAAVAVASLGPGLRIHSDFLTDRRPLGEILDELAREKSFQGPEAAERRRLVGEIFQGETYGQRTDALSLQNLLARIRVHAQSEYERGRVTLGAMSSFVATLGGVPGRRAVLYVADGIPQRPGEELYRAWGDSSSGMAGDVERELLNLDLTPQFRKLAEAANRSRVTLYNLDAAGDHRTEVRSAAVGGRVPSQVLSVAEANYRDLQEYTAQATGGRRLEVSPQLADDLDTVARDFVTFYSLGFTPGEGSEGEVRRIQVEVKRPGLVVRHRESYRRAAPEEEVSGATLAALLYGIGSNPLGISLSPQPRQPRDDGNEVLPLVLGIPVKSVALLPADGHYGGQISLFVTTQGAAGEARQVQKIPFHARIPADKLEEALGRSLSYTLPVVVRPGDRRVAVGVRDDVAGVASTLRLDL